MRVMRCARGIAVEPGVEGGLGNADLVECASDGQMRGLDALEDRKPTPKRVWNRNPDEIRDKVIERALQQPELSPREVAVAFTNAEKIFVSEASVYRTLKAEGLVTSPAFVVIKAADTFANPTTAINQL